MRQKLRLCLALLKYSLENRNYNSRNHLTVNCSLQNLKKNEQVDGRSNFVEHFNCSIKLLDSYGKAFFHQRTLWQEGSIYEIITYILF